ncbi:7TM GPCR serpentine receptor class x (Srx) domain-containing protein [Caenorhabditis elegans]|uniref:7TM GPCR serpentine receptor class x (Srx) domain-containing protein n=1 Tax=Caenorhabditis elegans TaxID=6239 RepID=P90823_CAEEL|nr:7TM GPCR serpentine receptor class x (Srx) domain-containing protein [Caenorhabditis elegans]CAB02907.2 7TM GPCR serpentine receptor class x (Srx) domain-containing protein [Caenorhabditis elegans]|eukprot:NP_506435.2 Serpentine Receptor, class X [Caenorhabditis elegans]
MITMVFIIFANFLLFIISFSGTILNSYLLYKFSTRRGVISGFYKLCLVKTVPNIVVCACFLIWAVPLGSFRVKNDKVPRDANVFVGQLAGAGSYIFGPLLHVGMSSNRFSSLYFPIQIMKANRYPITTISIGVAFIIAVVFTVIGLPKDCGFLYFPETLEWLSEEAPCAIFQYDLLLYSILGCAVISNSMNLATAGRLLFDKVGGMSAADSKVRRKKYLVTYCQTVLQDCLHVLDMINSTYTWQIYPDSIWFQFFCLTFSFASIHCFDGFVMFYFHSEVHPKWMWRKAMRKKSLILVVAMSKPSTFS